MNCLIRPVCDDDAVAIVDLLNPIIAAGNLTVMDQPLTLAGQLEYQRHFPERGVFHVAIDADDGTLRGVQSVTPHSVHGAAFAHVAEIGTFVRIGGQGRGVGWRLTGVTVAAALLQGYRKIMATVRADNPGAQEFYRRQGFRMIGLAHRHARVRGMFVDEILFERLLDPEP
jgi:L-amino acid N-acyltransferase YncA